jgi:hypothetical protein
LFACHDENDNLADSRIAEEQVNQAGTDQSNPQDPDRNDTTSEAAGTEFIPGDSGGNYEDGSANMDQGVSPESDEFADEPSSQTWQESEVV